MLVRRPLTIGLAGSAALALLLAGGFGVARAVTGSSSPDPAPAPAATTDPATGGGGNGDSNVAVAQNTKDGSVVYAVRLKVVLNQSGTVDPQNAAVAVASCTDCQTVAIALEGVTVMGTDNEVVAPENIALAINQGCTNCQTLASAYQDLVQTDGRVRMTGAGRKAIADLRKQLKDLRTSGLDIFAVQAEVDRIAGEFLHVLQTELVAVGKGSKDPTPSATISPTPDTTTG